MIGRLVAGLILFMAGAHGAQLPYTYFRGEPLRIGNQVQLLVDDYIVEDRWKLTRQVGKVMKHMRNPVLVPDKPWEGATPGAPAVLYDPRAHKFHMWYVCFNLSNYFSKKGPSYYTAYAESQDGFTWTKPLLEGFPFGEYERTNVVGPGGPGKRFSKTDVILNPDQSDPARRFVMVYLGSLGVDLAYSGDGLHWRAADKPLFKYHSDFPNHLLWVPELRLWYMFVRPSIRPTGMGMLPEGLRHTGRRLALATSADMEHWSTPRTVMYPDERDEPDFDNARVFRRHGVFFALYAWMFSEHGASETETHIATSRDGIHWEKTWDRKPLIARGPEGAYDHGQAAPGGSAPIEIGEEELIYYYASPSSQGEWFRESGVAVCRIRKDRYIGQWAGEETGYLLTRQFILEGSKLVLNCSSVPRNYHQESDGIRVEIIQAPDFKARETTWETAVPGFTLKDCDRIVSDNPTHMVTWNGKSDLSALKGKAVYLRFQMKKAGLFAFQVRQE